MDWDRRLFDSLVPLPDGTSYNAYLIEGSEKTVLLDTVDPPMADELLSQLKGVSKIDYVVPQHAEQDHSGTIPQVLILMRPTLRFWQMLLRPNTKFLSIIGSYGWGGKTVETLAGMIPNLNVEVIEPVSAKGCHPRLI